MKKIIITVLISLLANGIFAQSFTISGYIEDQSTGEKLIGANIYDSNTMSGSITNSYGFYSITLPAGKISLTSSFVGYNPVAKEINLQKDTLINFNLKVMSELEEVKIEESKIKDQVESTQMGQNVMKISAIKKLPAFLGEVDILKAIQLLPGVQSGTEGTSGFYVRGGAPDQNLILLDGVPVYNASHLFGFFSVFNADAIQSVSLIKGGFPARYGGRLSSVLDIHMKEGNNQKISGQGSIGLISSKLTLEGPITKKSSFIISGRRTYIDILAAPLIASNAKSGDTEDISIGYYFYDLTAKVNYRFSNKHRLYLSAYLGDDKFYNEETSKSGNNRSENKGHLKWGNITSALRWNYMISPKLFSNTTVTFSKYNLSIEAENKETDVNENSYFKYGYLSGIEDLAAKVDFDFYPNPQNDIKFGLSTIYHTFKPGVNTLKVLVDEPLVDTTMGNSNLYTYEIDAFIEDDIEITPLFKVNAGLHYSSFSVKNKTYHSFQPRLSTRYLLNDKWSVKAAYSTMTQYLHLLSNTSIGLPTDLWLPVTDTIKPMQSQQVAVGSFHKIANKFNLSFEAFYKTMDNLIAYKEGADYFSNLDSWENKVEIGKGWSYGFELLFEKKKGKTTGWIGYTCSWSMREFENINNGEVFPYRYDRRHDVSIAVNHKFSDKIDFSLVWVYGTGNAVTLPIEKYSSIDGGEIEYFDKRNDFRMPDYHRLDLSVSFHKKKKWGERTWTIGVYNAYNRQNPFYLAFKKDGEKRELKQYSLFPIIPSISYSFKF